MIFDYLLVSKFIFLCILLSVFCLLSSHVHVCACLFSVEPVSLLLMYCVNYYYYATKSLSSMWHCSATKE